MEMNTQMGSGAETRDRGERAGGGLVRCFVPRGCGLPIIRPGWRRRQLLEPRVPSPGCAMLLRVRNVLPLPKTSSGSVIEV
jgi:hypothetical protein